jgi:hypothetical protein
VSNSSVGGDLTQTINPKKLITKAVQGLFLGLVPLVSQSYLGSVLGFLSENCFGRIGGSIASWWFLFSSWWFLINIGFFSVQWCFIGFSLAFQDF